MIMIPRMMDFDATRVLQLVDRTGGWQMLRGAILRWQELNSDWSCVDVDNVLKMSRQSKDHGDEHGCRWKLLMRLQHCKSIANAAKSLRVL